MDTFRLLFLIFMVITPSACAETAEPHCEDFDMESINLLEGEAFYFVPYDLDDNLSNDEVTWYRNNSQTELISTDENESVHYHGSALLFLNLRTEDSGFYTARHDNPSGECHNFPVKIAVFNAEMDPALLHTEIKNSDRNKEVTCPDPVKYTCEMLEGKLTWKKDFKPLQGHNDVNLWIYNTTKDDEGIYTCTCAWTHNHEVYKSSGSRRLGVMEQTAHRKPEILSPSTKEVLADEGFGIKLNCSVFCGTNVQPHCHASWKVNGIPFSKRDGYHQTVQIVVEKASKNTISTAVLTIEKVSAIDFQTEFTCISEGFYQMEAKTLTLKRRDTIIPLVIGGVCVLLFCVFAAVLVKCFVIDLVLLFRPYFSLRKHNQDARVYDAYVVHQMHRMDKATEDALCQFIMKTLPSVLEDKCGYRLFIHGRDDIPGEDRLELVEDRMQQSKRLMVILSPDPGSEITDQRPASPQISAIGDFDWQVGLHHALVQREMSLILIQIGDTGPEGHKLLPPALQHLILKPIRWREGSRGAAACNSRFWKKVRYLMPAIPATKCPQSAII